MQTFIKKEKHYEPILIHNGFLYKIDHMLLDKKRKYNQGQTIYDSFFIKFKGENSYTYCYNNNEILFVFKSILPLESIDLKDENFLEIARKNICTKNNVLKKAIISLFLKLDRIDLMNDFIENREIIFIKSDLYKK